MQATAAYYDKEDLRRLALIPLLREVLGFNIQQIENRDKTKSDGVVEGIKNGQVFLLLVKEDKNEFGDGGSDPSTQVGLSAARAWVDHRVCDFLSYSFIKLIHRFLSLNRFEMPPLALHFF